MRSGFAVGPGTIGRFDSLRAAIERAWRLSDFHRLHWLAHGVPQGWLPGDVSELARLPVVTKEDLLAAQRRDAPWGGNLCIDERDIAQVHLTTGTSGIGQERYAMSAADVHVMGHSWKRQYEAIGLERGDVALLTIPVAFFCAGLSALEGARIHGLVPVLTGVASKDLMLDLLAEQRVAYLYGIESLLLQLANLARERGGVDRIGRHLKGIQSVGISPQLLEAAREVFHAPVYEVYGCTQASARVANTCALGVEHGNNHFHDEHLFIETRDPTTGELLEEGEAELIISTPYRQASPVIRFAMRDKLTLVPPGACACGSAMPGFIPGSLGRLDSMLKIRGVNLWPQQVEQLVLACPGVEDFRAEVSKTDDGADQLLIRIAPLADAGCEGLPERVEHLVRERTMVRPRVVIDRMLGDTTGAYKVRRWSDRRRAAS